MTNIVVTRIHMNYVGRAVRTMYEEYFNETSKHAKKKKIPDAAAAQGKKLKHRLILLSLLKTRE